MHPILKDDLQFNAAFICESMNEHAQHGDIECNMKIIVYNMKSLSYSPTYVCICVSNYIS